MVAIFRQQLNIRKLPKPTPRIRKSKNNSCPSGVLTITKGDMHGNYRNFLFTLAHEGIISGIDDTDYEALYSEQKIKRKKDFFTAEQERYTAMLKKMQLTPPCKTMFRAIGDCLADRGPGDGFTLELIHTLDEKAKENNSSFDMEILYSNHDFLFLQWYSKLLASKETNDYTYATSLQIGQERSIQDLAERMQLGAISRENLDKWTKTYLSKLKLFSYSRGVDEKGNPTLSFYTHARAGIKTLKDTAIHLGVLYKGEKITDATDISNDSKAVCDLIDAINKKFQEKLFSQNGDINVEGLQQFVDETEVQSCKGFLKRAWETAPTDKKRLELFCEAAYLADKIKKRNAAAQINDTETNVLNVLSCEIQIKRIQAKKNPTNEDNTELTTLQTKLNTLQTTIGEQPSFSRSPLHTLINERDFANEDPQPAAIEGVTVNWFHGHVGQVSDVRPTVFNVDTYFGKEDSLLHEETKITCSAKREPARVPEDNELFIYTESNTEICWKYGYKDQHDDMQIIQGSFKQEEDAEEFGEFLRICYPTGVDDQGKRKQPDEVAVCEFLLRRYPSLLILNEYEEYRVAYSCDADLYYHVMQDLATTLNEQARVITDKVNDLTGKRKFAKNHPAVLEATTLVKTLNDTASNLQTSVTNKTHVNIEEIKTCTTALQKAQKGVLNDYRDWSLPLRVIADTLTVVSCLVGIGFAILQYNDWQFFSLKPTDTSKKLAEAEKAIEEVESSIKDTPPPQ